MAIFTRLARLLRADLHALLDRMEAPDVLLQQSLREMTAELQQRQQEQQRRKQQLHALQQRSQTLQQQCDQQQSELALCLDGDNDTLARTLLRRQLEAVQLIQQLQQQHQRVQSEFDQAAAELQQRQSELQSLQAQAECWLDQAAEANPVDVEARYAVTEADVELALLKAKKVRSVT